MRRVISLAVVAVSAVAFAAVLTAGAGAGSTPSDGPQVGPHDLPSPLSTKQRALRAKALELQMQGKIAPGAKVGQVAKGQYVELAREGEDSIFTVLGEFGDQIHSSYGGSAGPVRNQIPAPDRTTDNTTIWTSDFSADYYRNLLFGDGRGVNSMRNWYIEQSSGRYAVNGDVTDWVKVPYNEARYGTNACGGIVCSTVWRFVNDAVDAWAASQSGDLNAYLARFDVWDRYDYDGDGNFNEPDGYIDHFQAIHAGVGEETGGGAQGANAIWSHRWYAYFSANGPDGAGPHGFGGVRIGNSNYWVGDYTVEPENGGVGVFSHEFGHDLGLPDEYDTSGNTGGAENSTGFWTNWSSGSYGNNGDPSEGIGDRPFHANAWDKLFLGWLNYDLTWPGAQKKSVKLGPAEANTKQAQAEIVVLPDKEVTTNIGSPFAGGYFYHSGAGNDLDNNMTRSITLPAGSATLSFQARYQIETCWDYAYVEVSTDGGATFHSIPTSVSTGLNENGQNFGNGITGTSGQPHVCDALGTPVWVPVTADLSAYAGQSIRLRFRYWTDGAVAGTGLSVDDIAITGQATDGGETDPGWTYDGFLRTTGAITQSFLNAYIAENRQYLGYDAGLKTGPYNFGGSVGGNWAERFPYQDGLLVWYYDTSQNDNNVGDHPGRGLILPIDAHPQILHFSDGSQMRPRIQSFDSTFSLESTDAFTIFKGGVPTAIPSQPGVAVFDDMNTYYTASDPSDAPSNGRYQASWNSVNHPHTGTKIRVKSVTPGGFMEIEVTPPK